MQMTDEEVEITFQHKNSLMEKISLIIDEFINNPSIPHKFQILNVVMPELIGMTGATYLVTIGCPESLFDKYMTMQKEAYETHLKFYSSKLKEHLKEHRNAN